MAAPLLPPVPPALAVDTPFGIYGISYDISQRKTEDSPPNGWGSHRGEQGYLFIL
jgi:hypothetical protein